LRFENGIELFNNLFCHYAPSVAPPPSTRGRVRCTYGCFAIPCTTSVPARREELHSMENYSILRGKQAKLGGECIRYLPVRGASLKGESLQREPCPSPSTPRAEPSRHDQIAFSAISGSDGFRLSPERQKRRKVNPDNRLRTGDNSCFWTSKDARPTTRLLHHATAPRHVVHQHVLPQ
jgi:hypothetical protein